MDRRKFITLLSAGIAVGKDLAALEIFDSKTVANANSITVTRQDGRYATLKQGFNSRWPASEADSVSRIELCENSDGVADALQRIVRSGLRPTVRSGGHCYEDFVSNNPNGVLIDLSMLNETSPIGSGHQYRVGTGTQLGDAYSALYKQGGVTLPGGSCPTVGAGGHICGGGYGPLSRLQGLTVDWLAAVDILTVDANKKVISRRVDRLHDPDLFRACRGAGGGNFGIITSYYFDKLPQAPVELALVELSFDWANMTKERFETILTIYGNYWETRGREPDTLGMFTGLSLQHESAGEFGLSVQFCNPDGTCNDLSVLNEFLDRFKCCKPIRSAVSSAASEDNQQSAAVTRELWLDAAVGTGGLRDRWKRKSAYMRRNFTSTEAQCIYKHLTRKMPGADLSRAFVSVDSYGGAINNKALLAETAVCQRSSVMKLQFHTLWSHEKDDTAHLQWISEFYSDLYTGPNVNQQRSGTPYPGEYYEGCYINYPDRDMLAYSFWPQLYYGEQGLYPFLQDVKRHYDPNNIFHHAMSIRVP
jgi:FAD binding domain/Berberine and berberine like